MTLETKRKLISILIYCVCFIEVVLAAWFYCDSLKGILFPVVLTLIMILVMGRYLKFDLYKTTVVLVAFTMAVCMPLLPVTCWIYSGIVLLLFLFLETEASIILVFYLICLSTYLADESIIVAIVYYALSMSVIFVFRNLDYRYKFTKPIFLAIGFQIVAEMALLLYISDTIVFDDNTMLAIINPFISVILMLSALKLYSLLVIHKNRERFIVINDQEFELLKEMKKDYPDLYYEGIHLNRFCMRVGNVLNIKVDLLRAECYYHDLRQMTKDQTDEELLVLCKQYKLPGALMEFVLRYNRNFKIVSREDAAFYIIHKIVTRLYAEACNHTPVSQYYTIVTEELNSMFYGKKLSDSDLTLVEYLSILDIFNEEKNYYELMCR